MTNQELNDYIKNTFNDEIALNTSFEPLNKLENKAISFFLTNDDYGNILIKAKPKSNIPFIFISLLTIFFSVSMIIFLYPIKNDLPNYYLIAGSSILGDIIMLFIFYKIFYSRGVPETKIFDFKKGYFYELRYKNQLREYCNNEKYKDKFIAFRNIYALQIIKKQNNFIRYELNLVLLDQTRVNVIEYDNIVEIKEYAKNIGGRLGIEVWDIY